MTFIKTSIFSLLILVASFLDFLSCMMIKWAKSYVFQTVKHFRAKFCMINGYKDIKTAVCVSLLGPLFTRYHKQETLSSRNLVFLTVLDVRSPREGCGEVGISWVLSVGLQMDPLSLCPPCPHLFLALLRRTWVILN